ncbi:NAD-dependent protein deacylase [Paenibacillus sp. N1-5-1-14]|uniref:NAD-dependent protein deacylase n=1 Tax=Paenibacillus radicibacter TaxID=2972488 RepID=UPI002159582B|nr:NAD-dependent protein deacylase [Paenibacillus radicibacter]MCR8643996.1 NAD-dependent protein deacylase [Paenibacillus radicibacter]
MSVSELKQIIEQSENIVFFGGAGTSTESGIPDFRSADGLYNTNTGHNYAPEEILSRDFFMGQTDKFYEFYKGKMLHPSAQPNPAHKALVELEKQGKLKAIITQNIDGLHQLAGSMNVLELHGTVHRNYCMDCKAFYPLAFIVDDTHEVPTCTQCGGVVKPDVVLYQESLDMDLLQRAATYIQQADVLIVAGTSLTVQPAAGLVRYYSGDKFILINKSTTPMDRLANYVVNESIAKVLGEIVG